MSTVHVNQNLEICSRTSSAVSGAGKVAIVGAIILGSFTYVMGWDMPCLTAFRTLAHIMGR